MFTSTEIQPARDISTFSAGTRVTSTRKVPSLNSQAIDGQISFIYIVKYMQRDYQNKNINI